MKKLFSALSLVLAFGFAIAQQETPARATKMPPAKVQKIETAKKEAATKPAMAMKPANSSAVKMKKDGTPDRRYKENQHLKKDGTPDKRYKK